MTTDLKTNYDVEKNTVLKKKPNDNCRKQTELEQTEDDANHVRLDKGNTQRSNLNSKHLNVTLVVKYPDYFICFYFVQ